MSKAPTLSIYTSHDRDLLFHGDVETARAAGIRVRMATRELTLDGRTRKIVNHDLRTDGSVGLWIV